MVFVRSTIATFLRNLAAQIAPFCPAGPLPITTRSYSFALIKISLRKRRRASSPWLEDLRLEWPLPSDVHLILRSWLPPHSKTFPPPVPRENPAPRIVSR